MELTQREMATEYDVSLVAYRHMELDADYIPGQYDIPRVGLGGRLALHEIAVILRFRSGLSQAETAEAMDLSKHWLRKMETAQAPTDRLLEYWELA
jgi:DNA-binding XRE family transcriptional regulator